jgi:hypothetical protein
MKLDALHYLWLHTVVDFGKSTSHPARHSGKPLDIQDLVGRLVSDPHLSQQWRLALRSLPTSG